MQCHITHHLAIIPHIIIICTHLPLLIIIRSELCGETVDIVVVTSSPHNAHTDNDRLFEVIVGMISFWRKKGENKTRVEVPRKEKEVVLFSAEKNLNIRLKKNHHETIIIMYHVADDETDHHYSYYFVIITIILHVAAFCSLFFSFQTFTPVFWSKREQ